MSRVCLVVCLNVDKHTANFSTNFLFELKTNRLIQKYIHMYIYAQHTLLHEKEEFARMLAGAALRQPSHIIANIIKQTIKLNDYI